MLLIPFSWIYGTIVSVRNLLYDRDVAKSFRAQIPVISVGNITVGGTGKTPHAEYILGIIHKRYRAALLSRGYGRKTSGYIRLQRGTTPEEAGDEPCQMFRKFPSVTFAVCEKRAVGLKRLSEDTNPEVVVLDDAFQHRAVTPSLNILLADWNRDILSDKLLPAGRLRENASARRRADIIIVTKCPDGITSDGIEQYRNRIAVSSAQKVFFSKLQYGTLEPLFPESFKGVKIPDIRCGTPVVIATGIATPERIIQAISEMTDRVSSMKFRDHHRFTRADIGKIGDALSEYGTDSIAIVTEKDAVKLRLMEIEDDIAKKIFVLPVTVRFIGGNDEFDKTIINHIENFRN